jgi:hypothetical protein
MLRLRGKDRQLFDVAARYYQSPKVEMPGHIIVSIGIMDVFGARMLSQPGGFQHHDRQRKGHRGKDRHDGATKDRQRRQCGVMSDLTSRRVGACPFYLDTRHDSPKVDTAPQSDALCCSQVMAIEQIRHVPRIACPFRPVESYRPDMRAFRGSPPDPSAVKIAKEFFTKTVKST